jgi:hypothetical protein
MGLFQDPEGSRSQDANKSGQGQEARPDRVLE